MEIDAVEKERPSLGLILEKTPEVVSIPRSKKRVEVNMGDGNGLLITNLGVVWKLLRPFWCPHPHASLIEETTERVRLAPKEDEDLAKLSVVHKLILPQMKESGEKTNNLESAKKMEPGSCLDSTCGSGEHTCDGRSCVRILSFQKEDLVTWFEDITEREKSEVQIVAECYARTTVNIATALGFFSRMCSLQSLERLESEHHLVTALSVESWPGVLQVTQKHIRSWKVGLEAIERKIPDRVNDGQFVRKPLPTAHGDGGSIQPENIGGQGLLSAQVREVGSGIASLAQVVEENQRDSTERVER